MTKPNVILLTIDTLRADRLGCYGYERPLTPNLDRLAENGVRFTQAITGGSWTQAAFPVIFTSTYAGMYGGCLGILSPERPSPITALADNGYETAGFSTSPLLSHNYQYHRGFDTFADLIPNESEPFLRRIKGGQRLLQQPLIHRAAKLLGQQTRPAKTYVNASDLTDKVCAWLDQTTKPFFTWVHYMDVHWPYHLEDTLDKPKDIAQAWQDVSHLHDVNWRGAAITPAQKERYISLYEEALVYTDAQVGRLLDFLEAKGLRDNTVVIVVADHGEEFLEHGRWGHWENNLHDEIIKVPLIIHLPNKAEDTIVNRQVHTLDLMPTILELCGIDPVDGMLGTSLIPLWQGQESAYASKIAISEMWRDEWHIISVRNGTYKYIWDNRQPEAPQLFDLQNDPGERQNISHQQSEQAAEFHQEIKAYLKRVQETMVEGALAEPELSDGMMARLRDLGYVE